MSTNPRRIRFIERGVAMKSYHETEIEKLNDTIKLYENLKAGSESVFAKNYDAVPYEVRPDELERKIMYYKAILTVYKYFLEKLGEKEELMLGKYISVSVNTFSDDLGVSLYLEDRETANKLYDYVFGSHSGINEFVQEHFPDIFSVILGSTGYSHALGCYDLNSAFYFFKRFGYTDYKRESLCWCQKDFDGQIDRAKKILDWFFKLSEDTKLMNDIDKVLTTYFEVVFKYNH